jgi:DNA excision repair protein ERCC-3
LILKENKYFVESSYPDVLQKLLKDPVIQECRLRRSENDNALMESTISKASGAGTLNSAYGSGTNPNNANKNVQQSGEEGSAGNGQETAEGNENANGAPLPSDITDFYSKIDADNDEEEEEKVVAFEVIQDKIEAIQKRCVELEYPLLAEYGK